MLENGLMYLYQDFQYNVIWAFITHEIHFHFPTKELVSSIASNSQMYQTNKDKSAIVAESNWYASEVIWV